MKIYDCFTFNDENHILNIRLNELDKFVDFFIIIEFGENHQGKKKGQKIDLELLEKFKEKIRYFYIEKFNSNFNSWEKENFQRNQITKGLIDSKNEDIIMISDVDEIPNLEKIDFSKINKYVYAFSQIHSMYKLNLIRDDDWIGTKLCKKKVLISPQWLRALKVNKKYNIFRLDKYFSKTYYSKFKIIRNGGWHFGWLRNSDEIIQKINSYAHTEHNLNQNNNKNYIEDCMDKNISFLNNNEKLLLNEEIDFLPKYILKNIDLYRKWIKEK